MVSTSPQRSTTFSRLRPAFSSKVGPILISEPNFQSKTKMINLRSNTKISNFLDPEKIKLTSRNKSKNFSDSKILLNKWFSISDSERTHLVSEKLSEPKTDLSSKPDASKSKNLPLLELSRFNLPIDPSSLAEDTFCDAEASAVCTAALTDHLVPQ